VPILWPIVRVHNGSCCSASLRLSPLLLLGSFCTGAAALCCHRSQQTIGCRLDPSQRAEDVCFHAPISNDHEVSWTAAYALIKRAGAPACSDIAQHGAVRSPMAVSTIPGLPIAGYLRALFWSEQGGLRPDPAVYADKQRLS